MDWLSKFGSTVNPFEIAPALTAGQNISDTITDLKALSGSNIVLDGKFNLSTLKRFSVNENQESGYSKPPRDSRHKLFTLAGTANPDKLMIHANVGAGVDDSVWEWIPVIYPHWFPVNASEAKGIENVIEELDAWPGKFGLCGYSQGAMVTSAILWQMRFGSLQHRLADCIGSVTFGNPKREVGHTFPGGIDPGGAGMAPDTGLPNGRIQNTPNWWWDFANSPLIPGVFGLDNFTCNPQNGGGVVITSIYQFMLSEFSGAPYDIVEQLTRRFGPEAVQAQKDIIDALITTFTGLFVGHMEYGWSRPLLGSNLTSLQLAINYLDSVGRANPLTPQVAGSDPTSRAWYWTHTNGQDCGFVMAPTERVEYLDVSAGETYMAEGWILPHATNVDSVGSIQIGCTLSDTAGNLPDTDFFLDLPQNGPDIIRGAWNKITNSVTIPSGFNRAVFSIKSNADTASGNKYWIKNVLLREETSGIKAKVQADLANFTVNVKSWAGTNLMIDGKFTNTLIKRHAYNENAIYGYSNEKRQSGFTSWKWRQEYTPSGLILAPTEEVETFQVNGGEIFSIEASIFPKDTNATWGEIRIGGTFTDLNGNLPEVERYKAFSFGEVIRNQWTTIKHEVKVPENYEQAKFWVIAAGSKVDDIYYIDDVTLREVTAAAVAQESHDNLVNVLASAFTGDSLSNTTAQITETVSAVQKVREDLQNNTKAIHDLQAVQSSASGKGTRFSVDFGNFSTMSQAGFSVSYTGSGTSTVGISSGIAQWLSTNNADRNAKIIYNTPTNTNYQILRGTMSGPPQNGGTSGKPKFHAIGRVSDDGLDYVFARAYSEGLLSYKGELGCVVNGVETVWQTNIPLTWSMDMTVACGVGSNLRQYQVWSGKSLLTTYTEPLVNGNYVSIAGNAWKISKTTATAGTFTLTFLGSTTTPIPFNATAATVKAALDALGKGTWTITGTTAAGGPWYMQPPNTTAALIGNSSLTGGGLTLSQDDHRKWGAITQIRGGTNGPFSAGSISGCSVSDNETPAVTGYAARMIRTTTTSVTLAGGSTDTPLPNNFFTSIPYESPDIDADSASGTFTVSKAGPYVITGRVRLSGNTANLCRLGLQVSPAFSTGSLAQAGDVVYPNIGGAGQNLSGTWVQYLESGQSVRLSTWCSVGPLLSPSILTGDSSGAETYFSIVAAIPSG
jgi:hypothetical protein